MKKQEIRHSYLGPRLMGFKYTATADPAVTAGIGGPDFTLSTSSSAVVDATYNSPLHRGTVALCTPGTDVADGGYCTFASTTRLLVNDITSRNESGTADPGTVYGLALGHDSDDDNAHGKNAARVRCSRRQGRLVGFAFDDSGFVASYGGAPWATIANNGTGDNTISFGHTFVSTDVIPVGTAVGLDSSVIIESTTASAINVKAFDGAGSATDQVVHLLVLGYDGLNEHGGQLAPLAGHPKRSRLLGFYITDTAGTPSLTIGGDDGAITDNAEGDYTITFTNSFSLAPIVVAMGAADNRVGLQAAPTTSACRVLVGEADGSTADDGDVCVLVLGTDYDIQF